MLDQAVVEFDQSAGGVLADSFDGFGVEHHSLDKPSEEDDSENLPTLADLNDKVDNLQDASALFVTVNNGFE